MIYAGTDLVYALESKVRKSVWCSINLYSNFTSFLVSFHRRFVVEATYCMEIAFLTVGQLNDISGITRKPLNVVLPACALENVLQVTRKYLERSHLKQPGAAVSVLVRIFFLPLEGTRISLRFFGLPKMK